MTRHCANCGNEVTEKFHRVFSDNEGVLRSCQECGVKTGTDFTTFGRSRGR